ncbi:ATP-binding protein [Candidatus Pantoea bituminis]|uniref:ATP-binding protein n=1 Tax=Candidatus Pantoea bituminis TaxID=2831036 RepID=UPI001C060650|nr:ATP-binding protein [Pantoea bituminis]
MANADTFRKATERGYSHPKELPVNNLTGQPLYGSIYKKRPQGKDMSRITVKAGADLITDIASAKPVSAISELIWNGFDAKSQRVEVVINRHALTGNIDSIFVRDSGGGIEHARVTELFGNLGESWKRHARANGDRSLHGQYGKGRFKALSLGEKIVWQTVAKKGEKHYAYAISADANSVKDLVIGDVTEVSGEQTGTQVEIYNVSDHAIDLLSENSHNDLLMEFALFLTEYPFRKLVFDGRDLDPRDAWLDKADFDLGDVEVSEDETTGVSMSIIEWRKKVCSESFITATHSVFPIIKKSWGSSSARQDLNSHFMPDATILKRLVNATRWRLAT